MTAEQIWKAFCRAGVSHVVGLPDTQTDRIFARTMGPGPIVVTVCREGEAFGIAAGLWAGGQHPVVLCQNTGLFEAGDALRSIHLELAVPLDLVIGWRGRSGKLNAGYSDTATELLVPTLDAWRVPYDVIDDDGPTAAVDRLTALLEQTSHRERGCRVILLPQ